jgi:hypothetical protein
MNVHCEHFERSIVFSITNVRMTWCTVSKGTSHAFDVYIRSYVEWLSEQWSLDLQRNIPFRQPSEWSSKWCSWILQWCRAFERSSKHSLLEVGFDLVNFGIGNFSWNTKLWYFESSFLLGWNSAVLLTWMVLRICFVGVISNAIKGFAFSH